MEPKRPFQTRLKHGKAILRTEVRDEATFEEMAVRHQIATEILRELSPRDDRLALVDATVGEILAELAKRLERR